MRVTVISTVLNEGDSIRRLMDSLAAQTRPPDEVVIVDGGSRDNTVAVLHEYSDCLPLHVLVEPGANISRGRNTAIKAATGDIIASVDAGVWLEPIWLEKLTGDQVLGVRYSGSQIPIPNTQSLIPNTQSPIPNPQYPLSAVAGFFVPDTHTTYEVALGATTLPTVGEIKPATFLPSSRSVAFTKAAWAAAGGYPEWIDYCEDLIFDFRLRAVVGPFGWAPEAVAHFRPRGSPKAFFKQYYRYARGDGKADLWRKRHAIRYVTYLIVLPALIILSVLSSPLWLLALLAGIAAYCRTPFRRLRPRLSSLSPVERVKVLLWIPVIRAVGDVAKMLGYPAGWVWRLRNWSRPEVHWRQSPPKTECR